MEIMANQTQDNLRILQWNCCSYLPKRGLIQNIAHEYDIIILIETWLNPTLYTSLYNNFIFIRKDIKKVEEVV